MELPNAWSAAEGEALRAFKSRAKSSWLRAYRSNVIPGLGLIRAGNRREGQRMLGFAVVVVGLSVVAWRSAVANDVDLPDFMGFVAIWAYFFAWIRSAQRTVVMLEGARLRDTLQWGAEWHRRREAHGCACPRCGSARTIGDAWCGSCAALLSTAPLLGDPRVRLLDGSNYTDDPALRRLSRGMVRWHSPYGVRTWTNGNVTRMAAEIVGLATSETAVQVLSACAEPADPTVIWVHGRATGVFLSGEHLMIESVVRGHFADGRLASRWDFVQRQGVTAPAPLVGSTGSLAA